MKEKPKLPLGLKRSRHGDIHGMVGDFAVLVRYSTNETFLRYLGWEIPTRYKSEGVALAQVRRRLTRIHAMLGKALEEEK